MAKAMAVSLNGNAPQVMNSLLDTVRPGFESFLGKFQGMDMGNFTPSSMANMLEKFNTAIDGIGLVKNAFQGDVPEVIGNLSSLAETFLENQSAAAEQVQDQDMDLDSEMSPARAG